MNPVARLLGAAQKPTPGGGGGGQAAVVQYDWTGTRVHIDDTFTLTGTTAGNSIAIFVQVSSGGSPTPTPATPSGFTQRATISQFFPDARGWLFTQDSIAGGTVNYSTGVDPGGFAYLSCLMVEVENGVFEAADLLGQQGSSPATLSASPAAPAAGGLLIACAMDVGAASTMALTTPAEMAALPSDGHGMPGSYGTEDLSASESVTVSAAISGGLAAIVIGYIIFESV